jgi:hypothetical protein
VHSTAGGGAFNAAVEVGAPLSAAEERELLVWQRATAIEEAQKAVAAMEEKVAGVDLALVDDPECADRKLEGMRQSLAAAREELARLRAEDGDN